jgi:hypothetical protein
MLIEWFLRMSPIASSYFLQAGNRLIGCPDKESFSFFIKRAFDCFTALFLLDIGKNTVPIHSLLCLLFGC